MKRSISVLVLSAILIPSLGNGKQCFRQDIITSDQSIARPIGIWYALSGDVRLRELWNEIAAPAPDEFLNQERFEKESVALKSLYDQDRICTAHGSWDLFLVSELPSYDFEKLGFDFSYRRGQVIPIVTDCSRKTVTAVRLAGSDESYFFKIDKPEAEKLVKITRDTWTGFQVQVGDPIFSQRGQNPIDIGRVNVGFIGRFSESPEVMDVSSDHKLAPVCRHLISGGANAVVDMMANLNVPTAAQLRIMTMNVEAIVLEDRKSGVSQTYFDETDGIPEITTDGSKKMSEYLKEVFVGDWDVRTSNVLGFPKKVGFLKIARDGTFSAAEDVGKWRLEDNQIVFDGRVFGRTCSGYQMGSGLSLSCSGNKGFFATPVETTN